jgi:diaminopropionate ammonia-lyase
MPVTPHEILRRLCAPALPAPTRLLELPDLAAAAGVASVLIKVEADRPLGNFKMLGGVFAGLRALDMAGPDLPDLICASDGNHGLAVATAARIAGTGARIYLPRGASAHRAARIEAAGGTVISIDGSYDDAVLSAAAAAAQGLGLLIPDTSENLHDPRVRDVMAGYALMSEEILAQLNERQLGPLSHLFIQAGVGGLAASLAEGLCTRSPQAAQLLVVEPESADCVARALAAGHPVQVPGDLHSVAEMLSCGLASAPALAVLLQQQAQSVVVSEAQLLQAVGVLREIAGLHSTPSGAAGLAGLLRVARDAELRRTHSLHAGSRVLLVVTEGA